jgi:hypothetical protein
MYKTILILLFFGICSCNIINQNETKLFPVKIGEEYGYVDRDGKIVINPQFAEAGLFRNGVAIVKSSGKKGLYGYIEESGKYVIQPQYVRATAFSDDLAWTILENGAPVAIDKTGQVKFSLPAVETVSDFNEGLAAYSVSEDKKEKWGFVNTKGETSINPQFTKVGRFSNGLCSVADENDKWGFIDKSGKIVINYQFTDVYPFTSNYAIVKGGEKYGTIDKNGKYTVNPQFDFIFSDDDKLMIMQDDKWGWADLDGKIIVNPQFANAYPFYSNKLAAVESGDKWGFIDKDGKIIINPQFEKAFSFDGKIALVDNGGQYGFINGDGKYVVNPQFKDVSEDYLSNLIHHESAYRRVNSDYFDVGKIVNNVKSKFGTDKINDIAFNAPIGEVLGSSNKTKSDIGKYSKTFDVIKNEEISPDADLTLEVNFSNTPWKESYSFWSNNWSFNEQEKCAFFDFTVSLKGKGYGKTKTLHEAMVKSFKAFKDYDYSQNMVIQNLGISNLDKSSMKVLVGDEYTLWVAVENNDLKILVFSKELWQKVYLS